MCLCVGFFAQWQKEEMWNGSFAKKTSSHLDVAEPYQSYIRHSANSKMDPHLPSSNRDSMDNVALKMKLMNKYFYSMHFSYYKNLFFFSNFLFLQGIWIWAADVWWRWSAWCLGSVSEICTNQTLFINTSNIAPNFNLFFQLHQVDRANLPSGWKREQPHYTVGASSDQIHRGKEISQWPSLCRHLDQICMCINIPIE